MMVIEGRATHDAVFTERNFISLFAQSATISIDRNFSIPDGTIIDSTPNVTFGSNNVVIRDNSSGGNSNVNLVLTQTLTPSSTQMGWQFVAASDAEIAHIEYRAGRTFNYATRVEVPSVTVDIDVPDEETFIYPADRCTWHVQEAEGGGYEIVSAQFWNGASTTPTDIPFARLGFIGKSGRFVEIAK